MRTFFAAVLLALSLPVQAEDAPAVLKSTMPKPTCYHVECKWTAKVNEGVKPDTQCLPGYVPDAVMLDTQAVQVPLCVCCPVVETKPEKPDEKKK